MSSLPVDLDPDDLEIQRASLRLVDVASDLRRFSSPEELALRLRDAVRELHAVASELRYLVHIKDVESCGLIEDIEDTFARLDAGWVPESKPVDELVASLRRRLADRATC